MKIFDVHSWQFKSTGISTDFKHMVAFGVFHKLICVLSNGLNELKDRSLVLRAKLKVKTNQL